MSPKPRDGKPQYRLSGKALEKRVHQAVHQALLENDQQDEYSEEQHYINMADVAGFDGMEEPTDKDDTGSVESEDETGEVSVLVAAALGQLLKD